MPRGHDPAFWSGRRVLVTGHTGFKGSWLTTYLVELGAHVMGVSLERPASEPSLWDSLDLTGVTDYRADIADSGWSEPVVEFAPQVVLHLAAQALVSVGYADPVTTFRSNTVGTINVMSILGTLSDLEAALIVTTDKVYDTRQTAPYDEQHFVGGGDPYAASKAAAELVVHSWPQVASTVTARAGNVIGGGDWSTNRIVPDLVRSWSVGEELVLRQPQAVRPWQHVIEPLIGYLSYCEEVASGAEVPSALNFGPGALDAVSVGELVGHAAREWQRLGGGDVPTWSADAPQSWKETGVLTLDATASKVHLGIENRWRWQEAVTRTLDWYLRSARGEDPRGLITEQFTDYLAGWGSSP